MRKIILSAAAFLMLFSCQNEETSSTDLPTNAIAQRTCASQDVLEEQLKADPTMALRMNEIEVFTQNSAKSMLTNRMVNGKIVIPVVVNVLYRTAAENISLAQIQSQIDVLNKDFTATNTDFGSIPSEFASVAANVDITFVLDQVIRKSSTKTYWETDDSMKKSGRGGINPTSPSTKLNIWVVNKMISGGYDVLGYAQFPGAGSLKTDGVVIAQHCMGNTGTVVAPYNLGRTGTHEVGHWMNLRHIWGDASCGDDSVADTPVAKQANYENPTYPKVSACLPTHNEMTMNYMDYTDDRAMYMFTNGQKARMSALFVSGGPRAAFGM